ncbi:MAG TPA: cupin domain-containing protein [Mycobacterium sp.]|nr:cupin domain-containing protein [Mycobacterium sp.]
MPGASKETAPVVLDTPIHTIRAVELGEFTVMWETSHIDHDAAPIFKGLPEDRCPCPHWCVVTSGRTTMRYPDHEETFGPGEVFYCPPGHIPADTAGTEYITFSPTAQLNEVMATVAKNLQAARRESHVAERARIQ